MLSATNCSSGRVVTGKPVTVTASEFAAGLGFHVDALKIRQSGRPVVQFGRQTPQAQLPQTQVVMRDGQRFVSQESKR